MYVVPKNILNVNVNNIDLTQNVIIYTFKSQICCVSFQMIIPESITLM